MPETFTTYAELVQFIETQSAEIIQGPWTQELVDAAKNLPTNGETADIISIVKQGATAGGGTATGAVALTGQSVASGGTGLYSAVGAFTSIGLTVAIAAGATALGVGIGYVAGQKLYEANPQLWAEISDAVLPACLKFESGSEPAQPQVPMVIGADGKSYLPKSFMDLLKDALINLGLTAPDTTVPIATQSGTVVVSQSNTDINASAVDAMNKMLSMYKGNRIDLFKQVLEEMVSKVPSGWKCIGFRISVDDTSVEPDPLNHSYGLYNPSMIFISPQAIEGLYGQSITISESPETGLNADFLVPINNFVELVGWWFPNSQTVTPIEVYENYNDNHAQGYANISEYDYLSGDDELSQVAQVCGLGKWIKNTPNGIKFTDGAILPDVNKPLEQDYPTWQPNWITVTKPPTLPDVEPDEQEYYLPVEIPPTDPEVGDGTQDEGQGGEISTIPQEIPIVTGLPEIITIINPNPDPPTCLEREFSICANLSKTWFKSFLSIPIPWSSTQTCK